MKVVIVNTHDIEGGAARAAYRLHDALKKSGVNSTMLVQTKRSDDFTVLGPKSFRQKFFSKLRPHLDRVFLRKYKKRLGILFSPGFIGNSKLIEQINAMQPDIVHLQWVNEGFIDITDIKNIEAPIVWTMHDDWLITGGCHIKWQCDRYKRGCGACPNLSSSDKNDLSSKVLNRKLKAIRNIDNLTVVAVSKWLANCAKESLLLHDTTVVNLPNLLNTELYAPVDKIQARLLLNLPIDKKLIIFGAMSAVSDVNKGFKQLSEALLEIVSENVELLVFGSMKPEQPDSFKQRVHYSGRLHDDLSLRVLYSAADVMVVPSIQEAFGQTAAESMACGTPVVAFATSGLLDIVDHKENGYLAEPYSTEDLAAGINWVLDYNKNNILGENARLKVLSSFDSVSQVKNYVNLYQSIMDENKVA